KKELKAPEATYLGDPEFKPIENTSLERAANTDKDIIKAGDLYYMLFQGVWFRSQSATGPWEVTGSAPQEIYRIPPSSPPYHVTYVTAQQEGSNGDWVTFAALPGYTGTMIAWGCAVWGSGWRYPPFIRDDGSSPAYFGYQPTYGLSALYNPHASA